MEKVSFLIQDLWFCYTEFDVEQNKHTHMYIYTEYPEENLEVNEDISRNTTTTNK